MTEAPSPSVVRVLTSADLDEVAAIHCSAFPESILSALGRFTVRRYYDWQFTGPHSALALWGWSRMEYLWDSVSREFSKERSRDSLGETALVWH